MEEKGFESVAKFCKAYNLDYVRVAEVIRGKIKPLNQKGAPIKLVEDMLDILDMSLEEAFTSRQLQGFSKTTMQTKMTEKQVSSWQSDMSSCRKDIRLIVLQYLVVRCPNFVFRKQFIFCLE